MRMMMKVSIPVEPGNEGIKNELLPKTIMGFVEQAKPESCYFTAENGCRTGMFFFDMNDSQDIPSLCEPFFMNLNASIVISPAMNLEDMKAGVQKAVKNL